MKEHHNSPIESHPSQNNLLDFNEVHHNSHMEFIHSSDNNLDFISHSKFSDNNQIPEVHHITQIENHTNFAQEMIFH